MSPKPPKGVEARYPLEFMWGDFALAGVGIGFVLAVILTTEIQGVLLVLLWLFLAAALWFFYRTLKLFRMRLTIRDETLSWWSFGASTTQQISDLAHIKLRFYGSRRQKVKGVGSYHLSLTFEDGSHLFADQRMDEFQALVDWLKAEKSTAEIDSTSCAYLSSFNAL